MKTTTRVLASLAALVMAGGLSACAGSEQTTASSSAAPTTVPVSRELVPVLEVGEVKTTEGEVRLGPHSALVARTA